MYFIRYPIITNYKGAGGCVRNGNVVCELQLSLNLHFSLPLPPSLPPPSFLSFLPLSFPPYLPFLLPSFPPSLPPSFPPSFHPSPFFPPFLSSSLPPFFPQYTHIILQYQDAVSYLMWCIEIILCTLRSSPHVCPTPQSLPPPQIHRRLSKDGPTSSIPSSPGSPPPDSAIFSNPLESPGRIRSQPLERILLETVPEESGSFSKSLQESIDMTTPHSRPPIVHTASVASYSSSISVDPTPSYNEHRSGVCVICHAPTDVFSEEVVALSITCLGTCAHHTPELVSAHLVTWMIPCIAKYVVLTCGSVHVFVFICLSIICVYYPSVHIYN